MSQPNQPPNQPGQWGSPSQPASSSGWGRPNSAWGQPAAGWQRPAESDAPAAPRGGPELPSPGQTPLGARQQPSVSLDQFKPKRNRGLPVIIALVTALVVGGILYFGTRPDPEAGATPTPSQTSQSPRPAPTPPTPGEFQNSIQFASDRLTGTFTVNDSYWQGETVIIDVTIQVDTGSLEYDFITMHMDTGEIYPVAPASYAGDLDGGVVSAGQSVTGTVRVNKPRGDTQLLLGDRLSGRNLTMLAVKG